MPAARSAAAFVHLPCDMGKKCYEFCPRGSPTLARRATSREDYQVVAREACLLLPKGLAHQPFNAVTIHCSTRNLSADDDADARPGQCVGSHEHTEVAAYYRRSARQGRPKLFAPQQALRPGQRGGARRVQTPNRARPLARRARITPRPPRVRIRTRKPCVRLRRVFDG
jgi:hypothetical protein